MRILLDESLPRPLRDHLPGHVVTHVYDEGWSGAKNGELLELAAASFDAFLTADRNLPFQQNLNRLDLRIVILAGSTNRVVDLLPLLPVALYRLGRMGPGEVVEIAEGDPSSSDGGA